MNDIDFDNISEYQQHQLALFSMLDLAQQFFLDKFRDAPKDSLDSFVLAIGCAKTAVMELSEAGIQ